MHPHVEKLLEVQKVDQEIARIRRDLKSLPVEETRRKQRLDELRAAAEHAKNTLAEAEMKSRQLEKGIQQADDEIKKLEGRLNTVKNNAEYQATLLQIESVKRERGMMEEEGLGLLEQLEDLRQTAAGITKEFNREGEEFSRFKEESEALRSEREAQVVEVSAGREELLDGIQPDLLDRYNKLFDVREGNAVCPVEGQVCMGCYTSVTTNDLAKLMGNTAIVQCGACQRILYLPT